MDIDFLKVILGTNKELKTIIAKIKADDFLLANKELETKKLELLVDEFSKVSAEIISEDVSCIEFEFFSNMNKLIEEKKEIVKDMILNYSKQRECFKKFIDLTEKEIKEIGELKKYI